VTKTAYIFPGQGSQYMEMGLDLYGNYPSAKAVFDRADEILGFSLKKICFEGPEEELALTINAQPALLVTSLAALAAAREAAPETLPEPAYMAGHSLGEYTALAVSGALDFDTAVILARERGRLMYEAGLEKPGIMAAILGLSWEVVIEICKKSGAFIANLNCPGQYVISGDKERVAEATQLAEERGAKKVAQLQVSGAFHSPLMSSAAEGLKNRIQKLPLMGSMTRTLEAVRDGISFNFRSSLRSGAGYNQSHMESIKNVIIEASISTPEIPVIGNTTARELTTAEMVRDELTEQVCHCVRWEDTIRYLISQGVDSFIEFGPGDALTRMLPRISEEVSYVNIDDCYAVEMLNN